MAICFSKSFMAYILHLVSCLGITQLVFALSSLGSLDIAGRLSFSSWLSLRASSFIHRGFLLCFLFHFLLGVVIDMDSFREDSRWFQASVTEKSFSSSSQLFSAISSHSYQPMRSHLWQMHTFLHSHYPHSRPGIAFFRACRILTCVRASHLVVSSMVEW